MEGSRSVSLRVCCFCQLLFLLLLDISQESFTMKCSLIVLILSLIQSAIGEGFDREGRPLDLRRSQDSALRARSLQIQHVLKKRTSPLRERGTCGSTDRCAKTSKTSPSNIQMQQLRRPQESDSSQLLVPPRQPSMEGRPVSASPRRARSPPPSPGSPGSPKTETIIHSDSSSTQSSPREPLLRSRNRLTSSSSFESRLSRERNAQPLPAPDPIPVSFDVTGRIVPKHAASSHH